MIQKSLRQAASNRSPIVLGLESFSEVTKYKSNNSYNTVVFIDNIPKGMRVYQFNKKIRNCRAKMFSFPGVLSNEIFHYIDVHLILVLFMC